MTVSYGFVRQMAAVSPVRFGQVVVGPPGSGKTTYCGGMAELLRGTGRPVALVNLDPANDHLPFAADLDLSELVTVPDVMAELRLGPNGALLYCLEYLEKNSDWLLRRLAELGDKYILFDFPGQVRRVVGRWARTGGLGGGGSAG